VRVGVAKSATGLDFGVGREPSRKLFDGNRCERQTNVSCSLEPTQENLIFQSRRWLRERRFSAQGTPSAFGGFHIPPRLSWRGLIGYVPLEGAIRRQLPSSETCAGHSGQRALTCRSHKLIFRRKKRSLLYSLVPSWWTRPHCENKGTCAPCCLTVQHFHTSQT
jgi:hypothetical protein